MANDSTELIQELQRLENRLNSPAANTAGKLGTLIRIGQVKELKAFEDMCAEWEISARVMIRALNILVRLQLVDLTADGEYKVASRL